MKTESLVVRHVGDIYRNSNSGKGHSWAILNGALHVALANCVTAHLPFELNDFATIREQFKGRFWMGTDSDGKGIGGRYYSLAVDCGNMSACLSFEKWVGIKPYLFMGRRLAVAGIPYESTAGELWWFNEAPSSFIRTVGAKDTEHELMRAFWNHQLATRWWVTGISSETIRLASYYRKDNKSGHRLGKPTKLMQLTHEQLDAASREIRRAIKDARPKAEKQSEA